MKNMWKISGWYLFVVGIIHNLVGVWVLSDVLRDLWNAGLVDSVRDQMDRNAAFWFLLTGFLFNYVGLSWQEHLRRYKEPLSKFNAWGLTVLVVLALIITPTSGFWIVLPLCFIMLYPHYFLKIPPAKTD
ncbi:MAG: DUF6463 family protein [Burkholderiales bacterium]|jgi:hypothetical protein|nr:DUF6463 family protein [Burkholderiales bacterium]